MSDKYNEEADAFAHREPGRIPELDHRHGCPGNAGLAEVITTCQRCGEPVEARRRSRKWCPECRDDKRRAGHRVRQRRYHERHRTQENERLRRWRAAERLTRNPD
jgi:hypothetical protein